MKFRPGPAPRRARAKARLGVSSASPGLTLLELAVVIFIMGLMLTLALLNQELLIPRLSDRLLYEKDDPTGEKPLPVHGQFDYNGGIHIVGETASRKTMQVRSQ